MSQPEFIKDISPEEIPSQHQLENHPLRNKLLSILDVTVWGAIIIPSYVGVGILAFGGGLDDNIRNLSLGAIGWTLTGAGLIYFVPKIARKVSDFSLGILEDIDRVVHH